MKSLTLLWQSNIPHNRWKELGEKLSLTVEDIQLLAQAKPQDKHLLNVIMQQWLKNQHGDSLHTLTKVLVDMDLHTIASLLLQHSDDSQWLK